MVRVRISSAAMSTTYSGRFTLDFSEKGDKDTQLSDLTVNALRSVIKECIPMVQRSLRSC